MGPVRQHAAWGQPAWGIALGTRPNHCGGCGRSSDSPLAAGGGAYSESLAQPMLPMTDQAWDRGFTARGLPVVPQCHSLLVSGSLLFRACHGRGRHPRGQIAVLMAWPFPAQQPAHGAGGTGRSSRQKKGWGLGQGAFVRILLHRNFPRTSCRMPLASRVSLAGLELAKRPSQTGIE